MSDPAAMTALVPLTVTNRGASHLVVKGGEGGDKTLAPRETVDTHSPAAVLDMVEDVKAEVQAVIAKP